MRMDLENDGFYVHINIIYLVRWEHVLQLWIICAWQFAFIKSELTCFRLVYKLLELVLSAERQLTFFMDKFRFPRVWITKLYISSDASWAFLQKSKRNFVVHFPKKRIGPKWETVLYSSYLMHKFVEKKSSSILLSD